MDQVQFFRDKSNWQYLWPSPPPYDEFDSDAESFIFHWVNGIDGRIDEVADTALEFWNEAQILTGLSDAESYFVLVDIDQPIDTLTVLGLEIYLNKLDNGYQYTILDLDDKISISAYQELEPHGFDKTNMGMLVIKADYHGNC